MPHRATLALTVAGVLAFSACSAVEGLRDDSEPPPEASAEELVLDSQDIPEGEGWETLDGEDLERAVADHVLPEDGVTFEPSECEEAALVTKDDEGESADFAGAAGTTTDGTGTPALAVVKDGRTLEDLREAREDCSGMTTDSEDIVVTMDEDVSDGPDIEGADDSFELFGTYESESKDADRDSTITRYGIVAEVRGTLVVVMVNAANDEESESMDTVTISDRAKAEAVAVVDAQVDRVVSAS